jgi:hypothetical protein
VRSGGWKKAEYRRHGPATLAGSPLAGRAEKRTTLLQARLEKKTSEPQATGNA